MTGRLDKPFVIADSSVKTYGDLFADLESTPTYCPYFRAPGLYENFRNMIAAVLAGQDITLLDANLSDAEVAALVDPALVNQPAPLTERFRSVDSFKDRFIRSGSKVSLFTSGTTGQPKKVTHRFATLALAARQEDRFEGDVWAYAYSPTHMAGLQVFIQTVANLNTVVDVFGRRKEAVVNALRAHRVTHLSATPTFYRLLLPQDFTVESVKRVTFGGERSDEALHSKIQSMFPSAKVANIYASTEAGAILKSSGSEFEVAERYVGKVRVQEGELQIHRSVMGAMDQAIQSPGDGEWYSTSDLVEVISESPLRIRFQARKNEMVNVGGYKVNPSEVEAALSSHPDVQNAIVFGRKNSVLGNMIIAEVQLKPGASLDEKAARQFLEASLQPFKIPRVIKFVDQIAVTHTGKAKRK